MALFYVNKKNKKVVVQITRHARVQFVNRWRRMYPESTLDLTKVDEKIESRFNSARRVKNLSRWEISRIKKHGPSLFFRQNAFTFVVADGVIVTIELSNKSKRHLN